MENDFSFSKLTPHQVLNSIESYGFECDGRLFELNSFENRVFQVGLYEEYPIIAKFYRPGRWSDAQIQEEHDFTLQLELEEVPALAPMRVSGDSLLKTEGYTFSLFRRQGGHPPDLDIPEHLESIGRTLGRMHAYGSAKKYTLRPDYPFHAMGKGSADYLIQHFIPDHFLNSYSSVIGHILDKVSSAQTQIEELPYLRAHGDCHLGNILWQEPKPFFVDFDDSCNAPQIADLWMLFSFSQSETDNKLKLNTLLKGYELFQEFDDYQLRFIEVFRVLRMINYASWIGTRWEDPAFKKAFAWFGSDSYWKDHILDLELQLERL